MATPSLRDVRIDWGSIETSLVAPQPLPPLFDGDRLTVYGRVRAGSEAEVAITARGPDGATLRFPVDVDLEKGVPDAGVCALMARRAIEDLEEGRGEARGSAQRGRRAQRTEARVLELALRYGVMSSQTSFVAIEERSADDKADAPAELRRVPVALTKGWGGLDAPLFDAFIGGAAGAAPEAACLDDLDGTCAFMCAAPAPPPRQRMMRKRGGLRGMADALLGSVLGDSDGGDGESEPEPEKVAAATDDLLELARSQTAEGAFEATETLLRLAGLTRDDLKAAADALTADGADATAVVATLVALAVFEERFDDRRDEWTPIARKARRWLDRRSVATPTGVASLDAWARELIERTV